MAILSDCLLRVPLSTRCKTVQHAANSLMLPKAITSGVCWHVRVFAPRKWGHAAAYACACTQTIPAPLVPSAKCVLDTTLKSTMSLLLSSRAAARSTSNARTSAWDVGLPLGFGASACSCRLMLLTLPDEDDFFITMPCPCNLTNAGPTLDLLLALLSGLRLCAEAF